MQLSEIGGSGMRAFLVRLPSGARYWTVLDEDLAVVGVADSILRQVRFGRDGAESTTKSYANSIALFLRWCDRTGRTWQAGIEQFGLFMTWLGHAGPAAPDAVTGVVLSGPGVPGRRRPRRGRRRAWCRPTPTRSPWTAWTPAALRGTRSARRRCRVPGTAGPSAPAGPASMPSCARLRHSRAALTAPPRTPHPPTPPPRPAVPCGQPPEPRPAA